MTRKFILINIRKPQKGNFFKNTKENSFKRERFNSDGNEPIQRIGLYRQSMNTAYSSNPNFFNDRIYSEEVKVDSSKVKYPLKSKLL